MTRGSDDEAAEEVLFTLRPSFLFVGIRYVIAALLWLATTAAVSFVVSWLEWPAWIGLAVVAVLGLVLFAPALLAHLRRQRYLYTLTNYKLEIRYGLLAVTTQNVPLSKIQDVTVTASILDRILGLGDVVIANAAEDGSHIRLENIRGPKQYADQLLRGLRRRN